MLSLVDKCVCVSTICICILIVLRANQEQSHTKVQYYIGSLAENEFTARQQSVVDRENFFMHVKLRQ